MANLVKQYSTATSGTVTASDTKQDVVILQNGTAVSLEIVFPANPIDGQRFTVSGGLAVTTLTLTSAKTVIGSVATLAIGGFGSWMYDITADKWFRIG
jgi:hypothetical protein